ncbi:TetR family transcriptional regulator [Sphaerisporangium krabiense]|uniref:AcrR family transcriptional regulator n=1 Tax=Sphaerisporangium krabiense TaxID=763782 RepID=A0A7W8Z4S7_9ACTN|nr:TetR/AcrR family transcriptional regulator [Sphaerisporangium krabiense]MBB5627073.1 AcrR family transcriptional regulator [Sphaerisporangium krabiense]GII65227.1 TetR family transcriptional regulator [Sphaerisporangium krabiense]
MSETQERPERADAVRNRRAILEAAEALVAEHGSDYVSLDKVAAAAGVGKGTVFRRFGSRTGLMRALLEERATVLSEAIVSGPPPLGPGAPPGERLPAFLDALTDLATRNIAVLTAHERACAPAKLSDPTYLRWHRHITSLLHEARPDTDADFYAHTLLSMFDADLVRTLTANGGPARLSSSLRALVGAILRAPA